MGRFGSLYLWLLLLLLLLHLLRVHKGSTVEQIFLFRLLLLRALFALGLLIGLQLLLFTLFLLTILLGLRLLVLAGTLDDLELVLHVLHILPSRLRVEQHQQFLHEGEEIALIQFLCLILLCPLVQSPPHRSCELCEIFIVLEDLIADADLSVATIGTCICIDNSIPSR